ncbi:glycosyltransferase family 2 protein [Candidatus Daviesbacteria bacterium]|nr:glycosyltransferase family 2 protein [Candidatus Daviesbacteria bacterium]
MNRKTTLKQIAILVPAHNEEVVLSRTLESALKLVAKRDLYVVNDGSTDKTASIARRFTNNVLTLKTSQGKAVALNNGIAHFKLVSKYQFIFPVDADTKISSDFTNKALKVFEADSKQKIVCVIGKVTGESNNWLTSYRMWEYEVSQLIHKAAQEKEQAIIVCPGCASVYRSSLFSKIKFSSDTVVEDMDLTFLIHRKKIGKIAFAPQAKVVTQDPYTLKDYLKQVRRWYKGYWQCLKKYSIPWGKQALDFELSLLTIEGLAGGLMAGLLLLSFPFIALKHSSFFIVPFFMDFVLFFFPTVFLTMFVHSSPKILKYLPTFYFLRFINSLVFLYSFFEYLFVLNKANWTSVSRYKIRGGRLCTAH